MLESKTFKTGSNITGILMMCVHAFFISILYIVVKILSKEMHSSQVNFLYKIIDLVIVVLLSFQKDKIKELKTKKIELHLLRSILSIFGSLCMFYSLMILPVANVIALSKLEHIIMVILGVVVLKEKITTPKIILFFSSLMVILLISDISIVNIGKTFQDYIYIYIAIFFWSLNNLVIKKMTKTETVRAQLFYNSLFTAMISFVAAKPYWISLTSKNCYLIFLASISSIMHKISFFQSYKVSEISSASPYDYLRIIITGILAYFFLHETPNHKSILGYIIIIISSSYFIISEFIIYHKRSINT